MSVDSPELAVLIVGRLAGAHEPTAFELYFGLYTLLKLACSKFGLFLRLVGA